MFWCKFRAVFESEWTKTPVSLGIKFKRYQAVLRETNVTVKKERKDLGESLAAMHSGRDWPTAFYIRSNLVLGVLWLWVSAPVLCCFCCSCGHWRKALSLSVCEATAVGAPGPEKGWARISLFRGLLLDAYMDAPVKIKVLIPREQFCVLHENHCVKCIRNSTLCSHPCQRTAVIYLLVVKDMTAVQEPGSDFQVLNQSFIIASVSGLEFRAKPEKKWLGLQTHLSSTFFVAWCSSESHLVCWL